MVTYSLPATLAALALLVGARPAFADVVDAQSSASVRSLASGGDPSGATDVTHDLGSNLPVYADTLEVEPTKGQRRARARSTLQARVSASADGISINASGSSDI